MEIFAEETTSSATSPRAHSWLLVAVISLFSLHLCYTLTVALYSGIQFLLVWNEIFRIQRPKLLQTELVTQIYHHTLSVDVPSCPICLIDYSTYILYMFCIPFHDMTWFCPIVTNDNQPSPNVHPAQTKGMSLATVCIVITCFITTVSLFGFESNRRVHAVDLPFRSLHQVAPKKKCKKRMRTIRMGPRGFGCISNGR
jgi:hypothetical protein